VERDPKGAARAAKFEMSSFALDRYMREGAARVEAALTRFVAAPDGPAHRLFESMRYSLLAGGKRLRPVLAIAACEAVGGAVDTVMGFACALEMIHTYSLIHDDLPCMDYDDLRRGRPSNHKVYGEALATLAGDGLLTDAFRVVASSNGGVPTEAILQTVIDLAEAAGSAGMVGGQVIDLLGEGRALQIDELELLHSKKTGALFVSAVVGGARLGGGNEMQLRAMREYGRALGLAFQVADDLLDVESTAEDLGKRTQKDHTRGKATYPSLLGVEASRLMARELVLNAHAALAGFDDRANPLRALVSFAVERKV
jgi:geranylgeranyl diphosphate synthase type II